MAERFATYRATVVTAAVLCALGAVTALSAGAIGSADRTRTYHGYVGLQRSVLQLTVTTPERGRPRGTFAVQELRLYCEDESWRFITPPQLELRFTSRRAFFGDLYMPATETAPETAVSVQGHITRKDPRRAVGDIYAFENPADAEPTDTTPECSTRIAFGWDAAT